MTGFLPHELSVPLNALQRDFSRLMERYLSLRTPGGSQPERPEGTWEPAIDVYETDDELVVVADLPGVESNAIDLSLDGRQLTLRGHRAPAAGEGPASSEHTRERPFGPFFRCVGLPCDVKVDRVRAEAGQGVLKIYLPKSEESRSRRIPVQTPAGPHIIPAAGL